MVKYYNGSSSRLCSNCGFLLLTLLWHTFLKVGDAGPLLDMMAATLEKLSTKAIVSRSTIQAVSVLALAVAYLPDHLYAHQVKLITSLVISPRVINLLPFAWLVYSLHYLSFKPNYFEQFIICFFKGSIEFQLSHISTASSFFRNLMPRI